MSTTLIYPSSVEETIITADNVLSDRSMFEPNSKPPVKKIKIRNGVTAIGEDAFLVFRYIEEIELEENSKLKQIGKGAFFNCTDLRKIDIGNKVTKIEENTFYNCFNLRNIIMHNVTEIEKNAFAYCKALDNVDLPKIERIGDKAFSNCTNLKKISMLQGVVKGKDSIRDGIKITLLNESGGVINNRHKPNNKISDKEEQQILNKEEQQILKNEVLRVCASIYDREICNDIAKNINPIFKEIKKLIPNLKKDIIEMSAFRLSNHLKSSIYKAINKLYNIGTFIKVAGSKRKSKGIKNKNSKSIKRKRKSKSKSKGRK